MTREAVLAAAEASHEFQRMFDSSLPPWSEIADRGVGRGWFHVMSAGIASYETALWVKLEDSPPEWEGTVVQWAPPDGRPVEQRLLMPGFSRNPSHCGGILVRQVPRSPYEPPTRER